MKKQLPLTIALGAGLMALVSVATVRAEPGDPDLPRCIKCPVFSFKDTNANGVYDTRVNGGLPPGVPDTYTDYVGLWELPSTAISTDDLYIVIRPNFENGNVLIGGDLKKNGAYPGGTPFNGVRTKLWEDTSLIKGIFGDQDDNQYDNDVSTDQYPPHYGGDYRLWTRNSPSAKAIVLHIDNRGNVMQSLYGFVWDQTTQPDKTLPNPPAP